MWRVFLLLGVHQENLRQRLKSFQWISIRTQASFRVSLGFPHWLCDSPRYSQTYHNHSHGAPVPVIRDSSNSEGRPECPPRVLFSPGIDTSKFTLRLHSHTPGGCQRLNFILLMKHISIDLVPWSNAWRRIWWQIIHMILGLPVSWIPQCN